MKFVIKKYSLDKKNIVLLLVMILLLIALYIVNVYTLPNNEQKVLISTTDSSIQINQQNLSTAKGISAINLNHQLEKLKAEKSALEKNNYNEYYKLDNELNLQTLSDYKKNPKDFYNFDPVQIKQSIAYYDLVRKSGQGFPVMEGENPKALGIFNYSTSWLSSVILLIFFALLCGNFLSEEFTEKIRFYHLVHINKRKILLYYLFTPVLLVFSALVIFFALLFAIRLFSNGWGSFTFPFGNGDFVTSPIWQIGLWSFLYLFLTLVFIASLGQFFALITKKTMLPVSILIIILVGFTLLEQQSFMQGIIKWIPFSYLGSGQVIHYSSQMFEGNSLGFGAVYLIICSTILFFATNFLYARYTYRRN